MRCWIIVLSCLIIAGCAEYNPPAATFKSPMVASAPKPIAAGPSQHLNIVSAPTKQQMYDEYMQGVDSIIVKYQDESEAAREIRKQDFKQAFRRKYHLTKRQLALLISIRPKSTPGSDLSHIMVDSNSLPSERDKLGAWESKFKPATDEAADSLAQLQSVMGEFVNNPSIRLDTGWHEQATRTIDRVDGAASSLRNLPEAPTILSTADSLIRKSGIELHAACESARDVVENGSTSALEQAITHQSNATDYANQAAMEMKRVADQGR